MGPSPEGTRWAPEPGVVYEGRIRHRRFVDNPRKFSYGLYFSFLDLSVVEETLAGSALTSAHGPAPIRYRRRDYFGPRELDLEDAVRLLVEERSGRRPGGEIFLLTQLRTFGVSFNPVSFYYCYDRPICDGGQLEAIVAEITNTPWAERHCYVLDVQRAEHAGDGLRWRLDKEFHVSPFLPMQMRYVWTFTPPGERLVVHMENFRSSAGGGQPSTENRAFDATLDLRRGPTLSTAALLWRQLRYPVMPAMTLFWIYRQAATLWLRRTRFYEHPES
ncbi:MAG: DUF1365 domain-containing protein [Thermoanaerobaculia bacterium]|nr:DUF1365 domain-containing protein [Thermoanaerobaculia bacterium]